MAEEETAKQMWDRHHQELRAHRAKTRTKWEQALAMMFILLGWVTQLWWVPASVDYSPAWWFAEIVLIVSTVGIIAFLVHSAGRAINQIRGFRAYMRKLKQEEEAE